MGSSKILIIIKGSWHQKVSELSERLKGIQQSSTDKNEMVKETKNSKVYDLGEWQIKREGNKKDHKVWERQNWQEFSFTK